MGKLARIKDIWGFLLERKAWWLAPILIVLFVFGFLLYMTQGAVWAPFVYSFF